MSDLRKFGSVCARIGGIVMVIIGILTIAAFFLGQYTLVLNQYVLNYSILRDYGVLAVGMAQIGLGVVIYYCSQQLTLRNANNLLWGILVVIFAILGGGIGGLIAFIGGFLLLLDEIA